MMVKMINDDDEDGCAGDDEEEKKRRRWRQKTKIVMTVMTVTGGFMQVHLNNHLQLQL